MIRNISLRFMIILGATFAAVHIILGLLALEMDASPWPIFVAMAVYAAGVVMVLQPRPAPFPLIRAWALVAIIVIMTILVTSQLPKDQWPGYASWHLAASYILLVALCLRGRVLIAWVGVLASAVLNTVWAAGTFMGPINGLLLNIATVGWLAVATGIGHLLATNDRQIEEFTSDARAAADWYAAEQALSVARMHWVEHVLAIARPALSRIEDPTHEITEDDRNEFKLIEAQFRDEIRGRVLATVEVVEAARKARERGVTVRLLDDRRRDMSPKLLASVSEKVVAVLNQARSGTVTARAKPTGGAMAVTILSSGAETSEDPTLIEIADSTEQS